MPFKYRVHVCLHVYKIFIFKRRLNCCLHDRKTSSIKILVLKKKVLSTCYIISTGLCDKMQGLFSFILNSSAKRALYKRNQSAYLYGQGEVKSGTECRKSSQPIDPMSSLSGTMPCL